MEVHPTFPLKHSETYPLAEFSDEYGRSTIAQKGWRPGKHIRLAGCIEFPNKISPLAPIKPQQRSDVFFDLFPFVVDYRTSLLTEHYVFFFLRILFHLILPTLVFGVMSWKYRILTFLMLKASSEWRSECSMSFASRSTKLSVRFSVLS
jgi:hypothetical protein